MTEVWVGAEVLRTHLVPIDELVPSEENARKGDVMALVGSLRRFGQVRAILSTPEGKIVAGHHLRLAAIEMGWTHIATFPNEFANDDERLAYLVADNQLSSLGGYDEQAQMTILEDLETRGLLEGTGFDSDTIDDMRVAMEAVPSIPTPETWGGGFSETAEEAEARALALSASKQKREVLMMMDVPEYEQFGSDIRHLQGAQGTTGVKDTVVAAVRAYAAQFGAGLVTSEEETPEDVSVPLTDAEESVPDDDFIAALERDE
jgi:hypothetical protein